MSNDTPAKADKIEEKPYDPPRIIYEDTISTRAGSPIVGGDTLSPPEQEEAIELFPSD